MSATATILPAGITLETIASRVYVRGNTFAFKDTLKSAGCHWDGEQRAWWIGKGKIASLEGSLSKPAEVREEDARDIQLRGKAEYKGKSYYVRAVSSDEQSFRLTTLDGKLNFWAKASEGARMVKQYQQREERGNYGKPTGRYSYPTLRSMQNFMADLKKDSDGTAPTKRCWECGCAFTQLQARTNGGDWNDSYCGC